MWQHRVFADPITGAAQHILFLEEGGSKGGLMGKTQYDFFEQAFCWETLLGNYTAYENHLELYDPGALQAWGSEFWS